MPSVADLKACPLFKDFTETGLTILLGIAQEKSFPKGSPLFVESMVGDSMFIVVTGQVRLTTKKNNQEIALGELGGGDALGELSLIQQGQRLCTATALTPVSALELRAGDFQKLMAQKPQACIKLLMAVVSSFAQRVSENREVFKAVLGG
jgi:CRP-like cAMP-binding protein